jgi:hypothetical protein
MKTRQKPLYGMVIALTVLKLCFFGTTLTAQSTQGIYLSGNDFVNNKLSYTHSENCKVKIRDGAFNSYIKVTCGETVLHLSKDSVFGYRDHENVSHRFFNKTIYEVINQGANILLYKLMTSAKTKYQEAVYGYYFSKDAFSPILSLTINNLENSFQENKTFIDRNTTPTTKCIE